MEYAIQQTEGIKSKLFSIYQDGVEWVRSLSLVKAKKIVEGLTSTTAVKIKGVQENDQAITTHEYLNRSDDVFGENRSPAGRVESTSLLHEEESFPVFMVDGSTEQTDTDGDGGSLCVSTPTDGDVPEDPKLAEFQRMVLGITEISERQHQLVREQGQLVREQGQLVREQGQLVREQGQLVQRVAFVAEMAITGGIELCNRLEAYERGSGRVFRQNLELEMQTVNVLSNPV